MKAFEFGQEFNPTKMLAKAGTSGDPEATPSVCLYKVLLKPNSTEDVALFINSTTCPLK